MKQIISYDEAVEKLIKLIEQSNKSHKLISIESNVSYNLISLIKNNYKKRYPQAVQKLLHYFNIEIKEIKAYEILK